MKIDYIIGISLVTALLLISSIAISPSAYAGELPDSLYSKGGIIYPKTGDSTQEVFRTPANVWDFIEPGMLIGVLPADCKSASRGTLSYYRCSHNLDLVPEEHSDKTAYRVLEAN